MLALAWFVFYAGAAIASPFVAPQPTGLLVEVCAEAGQRKSILIDSEGEQAAPAPHQLHCPLCLLCALGPPLAFGPTPEVPVVLAQPSFAYASAPVLRWLGAPLPPRGPPPH